MRFDHRLIALAALAVSSAAHAVTLVQSTFDAGTEGWNAINGVDDPGWVSTGGDPGGYVSATDTRLSRTWLWVAPSWFEGDWSGAYGGSLSFSLKVTRAGSGGEDLVDVKLGGGGISLVIDAGPNPGTDWTRFSLALAPGAWHVGSLSGKLATADDIAIVLSNVSALHIRGEYGVIERDTGSLDSVIVASAPVPEPAAWILWLGGGLALAAVARRRPGGR